jgi:hypothetical protein
MWVIERDNDVKPPPGRSFFGVGRIWSHWLSVMLGGPIVVLGVKELPAVRIADGSPTVAALPGAPDM